MRHAQAIPPIPGDHIEDFERKLDPGETARARRLSPQITKYLAQIDFIYCSVAIRTQETYALIQPYLALQPPVIYVDELYVQKQSYIDFLWPLLKKTSDQHKQVLVIGHNPGLTNFYNDMPTPSYERIHFPTFGLAVIQLSEHKTWQDIDSHQVLEKNILT